MAMPSTAAAKPKKEKEKKKEDRKAKCASVERAARREVVGGARRAVGRADE